ncbi:HEAT repeat domain-containing protein [candidate division KSB1 bacterium]|nr:HEAT repeat domain-containing protein [candidate division KSB1 bacterium]
MNWERYLQLKRQQTQSDIRFLPENQSEAKQALALGVIDISQYVEFSLGMEPLLDTVHDPEPDIRKEAIRRIAERRTPLSIQMLHGMLLDEDEEVRLYTASELDRLEDEMQKRIHKLRKALEEDQNDHRNRFELAKTYIEFTRLLVTSEVLGNFFLKKAIELLNKNFDDGVHDANHNLYRGWAFQLKSNYAQALLDLKEAIRHDKSLILAYIVMAEIYFLRGRYDFVKKIMKTMPVHHHQVEEYYAHLYWGN